MTRDTKLKEIRDKVFSVISELKSAYNMELLNEEGRELYEVYNTIYDLTIFHSKLNEFLADEELAYILDKHKYNYRVKRFIFYLDRIKKELESNEEH